MSQKYTPEPWELDERYEGHIQTSEGDAIADTVLSYSSLEHQESVNNARRIVAAVNACAGIKTIDLECLAEAGDTLLAKANEAAESLRQQRDDLLYTLECIESASMDISVERRNIRDYARAAIAKAKEQA